jgi:hypothetical protein
MNMAEEIIKSIESVKAEPTKPLYLVAFTDYQEQKYKEWYPGVEILRAPQKIDGNKTRV